MKLYMYMRNDKKKMVSLNPEYGLEVSALKKLSNSVKKDNPELDAILTILIASIIGKDEKKLMEYCNKYLEDKVYSDKLKNQIEDMINKHKNESIDSDEFWDY
jgi:divalent metal cation (Fe/Co/Zn/Cd) transporter